MQDENENHDVVTGRGKEKCMHATPGDGEEEGNSKKHGEKAGKDEEEGMEAKEGNSNILNSFTSNTFWNILKILS